ncbi:hypothetical protein R3P38DRAFT_3071083 [Favolaschia claudopus]|uniref:Uncharacterized protein n=1 Tax=Favolaschia claudopus TaxID=2862362 RepID=A0AAV9ZZE9_9AGAR
MSDLLRLAWLPAPLRYLLRCSSTTLTHNRRRYPSSLRLPLAVATLTAVLVLALRLLLSSLPLRSGVAPLLPCTNHRTRMVYVLLAVVHRFVFPLLRTCVGGRDSRSGFMRVSQRVGVRVAEAWGNMTVGRSEVDEVVAVGDVRGSARRRDGEDGHESSLSLSLPSLTSLSLLGVLAANAILTGLLARHLVSSPRIGACHVAVLSPSWCQVT